MRIEKSAYAPNFWTVTLNRAELAALFPNRGGYGDITIGVVDDRGRIRVWTPSGGAPRNWSSRVKPLLTEARRQLIIEGKLHDREGDRRRAHEQRTGSFILALFDGRVLRFHGVQDALYAAESARRAQPDLFEGALILRSGLSGDGVIQGIDGRGNLDRPRAISPLFRSALAIANAMRLEGYVRDPNEPHDAWLIAADALEEARRPKEARSARRNAERWARTAHVSTRVPASRRRRDAR